MTVKNNWTILKNRYRLSTKIQMNFELSFPKYLIGKCRCTINNNSDIKRKKVSPSKKGVVFSDTIPLGWFTSSLFIPWEKVVKIDISNTAVSSGFNNQMFDDEFCTLQLDDPVEMTIDFPWSKEFADAVKGKTLFDK